MSLRSSAMDHHTETFREVSFTRLKIEELVRSTGVRNQPAITGYLRSMQAHPPLSSNQNSCYWRSGLVLTNSVGSSGGWQLLSAYTQWRIQNEGPCPSSSPSWSRERDPSEAVAWGMPQRPNTGYAPKGDVGP